MSNNLRPVEARICPACQKQFTPKAGGYNAVYCSKSCKQSIRGKRDRKIRPEIVSARRSASYKNTKSNPERYEKHKAGIRNNKKAVRQWLADYKMEKGCIDCGFKEHFAALQLDHEGEKRISIAHARSSISRLKEEIRRGKCVVRCANCHSIKTWERKQNADS